jgi:WD40 repeat protein
MSAKRKQLDDSGKWHTDDITALTVCSERKRVASGQNGVAPTLHVWDAQTAEIIDSKKLPKGCRLVTAVAFAPENDIIYASDAAEKICVHMFRTEGEDGPFASI